MFISFILWVELSLCLWIYFYIHLFRVYTYELYHFLFLLTERIIFSNKFYQGPGLNKVDLCTIFSNSFLLKNIGNFVFQDRSKITFK